MSEQEVQIPEPQVKETLPPVEKYLDDEGKFTEEFRNSLPDGLGQHSVFEKYGNFTEMVKGAVNAQKVIGERADEWWKSEDEDIVAQRREIMGIPKDAKGYEWNLPDNLPEGLNKDKLNEYIGGATEKFAELGITKDQAKALIDWDMENLNKRIEDDRLAMESQRDEAEKELRKEWKGDKFDYNISKVKDAISHLNGDEWFDKPEVANNPAFIKWVFENLVPLLDNDEIVSKRQSESYASVQDALTEVEGKIYDWKDSRNDPRYLNMIKQRTELLQKIAKK